MSAFDAKRTLAASRLLKRPCGILAVGIALLVTSCTAVKFTLPGGFGTGSHSRSSRIARPRKVGELRPECE